MTDEFLAVMSAIWHGESLTHDGVYCQVKPASFPHLPPASLQQPILTWMVGHHGNDKSMGRAIRYQGLLPTCADPFNRTPEEHLAFSPIWSPGCARTAMI
jgi:hypothetical protein